MIAYYVKMVYQDSNIVRHDSDFLSKGVRCAGWLFRPGKVLNPPIVIMAHGFAGERTFGLPVFAQRFAQNGMAVFLFDYRNFGDSEGQPRNLVDPARHCQDWESAIAHVWSLPEIDTGRIALWGTSLSGGHVIVTAARQKGISAIVAQVPYVGPNKDLFEFKNTIRGTMAALQDMGKMLIGRGPFCVPVVGTPGAFAFLTTEECWDGYHSIIPDGLSWDNLIPARSLFKLAFYNPMRSAAKVTCPALLIAGEYDSLIPSKMVKQAARKMAKRTYIELPCNHFAPYTGEFFEQTVRLEIEFLHEHLKIYDQY
ncbi:MAG: alpha/beta hydrolase [Chloroflexi bacterium]|nr:alpha/beta hydrolase [Chloroflexota bacterium]